MCLCTEFVLVISLENHTQPFSVNKKELHAGMDPEKELKDSGFGDLSRAYVSDCCAHTHTHIYICMCVPCLCKVCSSFSITVSHIHFKMVSRVRNDHHSKERMVSDGVFRRFVYRLVNQNSLVLLSGQPLGGRTLCVHCVNS